MEPPDLTITDILMPEMDGYQLVQKLREVEGPKKSKFIFYSATYLESEALALARACGVSHVICKPAEPELILKTVEEALASGQSPEQTPAPSSGPETPFYSEAIRVLNDKLYRKVEEAEELNKTLEKRVADRTWELEISNHNLKKEILERQKAEAEAMRSREEQLRVKGEFLSHISHELRSPLSVIHQFTTILLDGLGGALNQDQRDYLEITFRNVKQLKLMIDDLLEASRAETKKLTVRRTSISTTEMAEQVVQSLSALAKEKRSLLKMEPIGETSARLCGPRANFPGTDQSAGQRNQVFASQYHRHRANGGFRGRSELRLIFGNRLWMRNRPGTGRACIRPAVSGRGCLAREPAGFGPGAVYLQGIDRFTRRSDLGQ